MNTNVAREKYLRLMTEIEEIEDKLEKIEGKGAKKNSRNALTEKEVLQMKVELAAKKEELARISDGCGKPHAH